MIIVCKVYSNLKMSRLGNALVLIVTLVINTVKAFLVTTLVKQQALVTITFMKPRSTVT